MTVYVDDMYKYKIGEFGRMKMSHMMADTEEELLEMADTIGLNRRWIQHEGKGMVHFDVSMSMRKKAVDAGAQEVTMRELIQLVVRPKKENDG